MAPISDSGTRNRAVLHDFACGNLPFPGGSAGDGDVDADQGTVRIVRAWKVVDGGVKLGPPKSNKSVRTINVAHSVLDKLDYDGDWLFRNRAPAQAYRTTPEIQHGRCRGGLIVSLR